ncbi:MAG: MerR family transcriptional regulator [Deltaproteobacteria bacterium]|nr:MerR family transcriptional regulator [Deltaproteobacteria bacterium]
MTYRIKTVSERTGIPRPTLLAWERRYQITSPDRQDGNNYRVYSEEDVALLVEVKALVDGGMRVSEALAQVRQRRQHQDDGSLRRAREALLEALLALDREGADAVGAGLDTVPFTEIIHQVYLPLVRALGTGWAAGSVTVAQEHYASEYVRARLAAMLLRLGSGPVGGPTALCAGLPGDRHELGLLSAAVELALRGYRVYYLGADVPIADLVGTIAAHPPVALCLSRVLPGEAGAIGDYLRAARAAAGDALVIAGGEGLAGLALPEGVRGVAALADLGEAVRR